MTKITDIVLCLVSGLLACTQHVNGQETKARIDGFHVSVKTEATDIVTMTDLGIEQIPRYHALIIGISDYKFDGPKLTDLERPVKDAERLYNVLTNLYSFNREDVIFMRNPTYQELTDTLLFLSNKVKTNENLLIFYAGHGYYDPDREFGYWIPSDAQMETRSNWVSNTTLRDNIGAVKSARHTLLITDACFGGSIFKGVRGAYEDNLLFRFKEAYRPKSRKAITSGNLSQVPDKSLFLEQFIQKLEENKQPYVTAFSLYNKIYDVIINNSETTPKYGAIQGVGDEGGDFVFIRRK